MDDPIWLWPSGKPNAVKSLILLDEIRALLHWAYTMFPKRDFVQNISFVFSAAGLIFCWFLLVSAFLLGLFFYSITCLFSAEVPLSQVSMLHQNSRFTPMPKIRAFLAMPCGTACLTNMQQPFQAGQRHVGNHHALAGNECNDCGNINSTAQDPFPDSVVSPCALWWRAAAKHAQWHW